MSKIVNIPDENFRKCILKILNKYDNYEITKEDCESKYSLYCDNEDIKNLIGIEHFVNLEFLCCSGNQLTSLDLSKNIKLKLLYCRKNQLTSLNVSKNINLTDFACSNNQLTSLCLSENIKLIHLYCSNNTLTSLDLNKNIILNNLDCVENQLTSLKLNKKINCTKEYKAIITNFNTLKIQI